MRTIAFKRALPIAPPAFHCIPWVALILREILNVARLLDTNSITACIHMPHLQEGINEIGVVEAFEQRFRATGSSFES